MNENLLLSNPYLNPELKLIFQEEFDASLPFQVIQAIYLLFHPKSEFYALPLKDKVTLVERDFLKAPLDLEKLKDTVEKFKKFILTKAQRSLLNWEEKLEERDLFMASKSYDDDTYEMLDKMMMQTSKMWDQYSSILKAFSQESESQVRGDVEESLVEKGLI